jgi:urease accessory protein
VGAFAIFHGYAHGAEFSAGSDAVGYSAGFALASLVLHIVGLPGGFFRRFEERVARLSGVAIATAGLWVALS